MRSPVLSLIHVILDRKRLTAEQVLGHPWMKENGVADDQAFTPEVLTRLRAFGKMNFLKKEALKVSGFYLV